MVFLRPLLCMRAPLSVGASIAATLHADLDPCLAACCIVYAFLIVAHHAVDPECPNNPFTPAAIDKFVRDLREYQSMVEKASDSGQKLYCQYKRTSTLTTDNSI